MGASSRNMMIAWIALLLIGCEDPIALEIPTGPPRIVVEGNLVDAPFVISLSYTNNFNDSLPNPPLAGAMVSVEDWNGATFPFEEVSPGKYRSPASWSAIYGNKYRCMIATRDGKRIVSNFEELVGVPPIDSMYVVQKLPAEIIDGEIRVQYLLNALITDPASAKNFYRWLLIVNDVVLNKPADLILFNDRFVNGSQFNFHYTRKLFDPGDTIKVRQISLSEGAFNYFNLLFVQATRLGQASGTAPATLRGNLSNRDDPDEIILGYFWTSEVHEKLIFIKNEN